MFIYRWIIWVALLVGNVVAVFAQDVSFARAQRIYDYFVAGQGDSIYVALNKDTQQQLSPALFTDIFRQTESMMGKLQSKTEWQTKEVGGTTLYYSDLTFERHTLRFLLAFDADGKMNTIRLSPLPAPIAAQPQLSDKKTVEEREITVGAEGYKLPGTLTLPKRVVAGEALQLPCVILVHGSGAHDRDETIGPNKPFRDLAWGLAERGIAVIRYDKRSKVYGAASVPKGGELNYDTEVVDDVLSAVKQARTLSEIAPGRIYVLGHSLGGTVAPRIAERTDGLAGIIILAGLARPLEDAILEQSVYLSSLAATPESAKAQVDELKRQCLNIKKLGTDAFDDQIPLPLGIPRSYWAFANTYKPVDVAARLKLPILVLQGERDYQVTMEDFGQWRSGLLRSNNASFKSYPQLNHLMQEGTGKSIPLEYNQASSFPPYVIQDIASFIQP